jgi:purine-binding chemotaxis protein CheW
VDGHALAFRAGPHLVAIGLAAVTEVARPLPVRPLAGVPPFVRGICVLRGVPVPIIEVRLLLGGDAVASGAAPRFVGVRTERHPVALAVDEVLGIRDVPMDLLYDLSSVFGPAGCAGVGVVGEESLLFLTAARVVPETLWTVLEEAASEEAAPEPAAPEPAVAVVA